MELSEVSGREKTRDKFLQLRAAAPQLRIRDAAARLAVSEAELLSAFTGAPVKPLRGDWRELLPELGRLGRVMALTRNESAVIEKVGHYEPVDSANGVVLGEEIDLRVFLDRWHYGFAVADDESAGFHRSLQFFDQGGAAVHKVFLRPESSSEEFDALVSRWQDSRPALAFPPVNPFSAPSPVVERQIDVDGLRQAWGAMQDSHDVFGLLKRFGLERGEALPLLGSPFAIAVDALSLRVALERAAATSLPVMVFVGNEGAVQIHTGPVEKVAVMGPWLNVLDEKFNLHVLETAIAAAWVVRRPTVDGTVTSLDLFDTKGELILQLFGKRKPGQPELEAWRSLAASLPVTDQG